MCAMLLLQYKYSFVHMIATPRNLALLSTLAGSFIYRTSRILEVFFFHRNICAKKDTFFKCIVKRVLVQKYNYI